MHDSQLNIDDKAGFIGGTFLAVLHAISFEGMLETAFYAVLGTVVSFSVSYLLKYFTRDNSKNK